MTRDYIRVNVNTAGVAYSQSDGLVFINTDGLGDVVSVEVVPNGAKNAWTNAILKVRKTNTRNVQTAKDYTTAQTLTPSAPMTGLLAIESQYIVVEVTTGEGSDTYVDIHVHMRPSNIGAVVIT